MDAAKGEDELDITAVRREREADEPDRINLYARLFFDLAHDGGIWQLTRIHCAAGLRPGW